MADWRCLEKREPHYDLTAVKAHIERNAYEIPRRVRRYMDRQEWVEADIRACVRDLRPADFHKSQMHACRSGVWLDIYRPRFEGCRRYLKFTERESAPGIVILSFCRDGEAH